MCLVLTFIVCYFGKARILELGSTSLGCLCPKRSSHFASCMFRQSAEGKEKLTAAFPLKNHRGTSRVVKLSQVRLDLDYVQNIILFHKKAGKFLWQDIEHS